MKLFNEKKYAEATRILTPLAEAENETALKLMSQAYQYGRGVPDNKPKSLELLRKAAAIESDGWANYALGMFHLKGSSGAEKDEQLGLSYIERANELRHAGAFKVLEANFPGKYSLGQRSTKHQELNPSEKTAQTSSEIPFAEGSVFEGKNPCPGQNGLVQILIESIQNRTSPGPVAVNATISFDFKGSAVKKSVTARYFPGHRKLVLHNSGLTMLTAQQSSDNLIVLVSQDGKNLSEEFNGEGLSKPEDKPSNCSTLTLSAAESKPNKDQVTLDTNIQEKFNPFILPDLSIMPEKEIEQYFSQLRAMSITEWADLPRGIRCGHVKINLQYRKSRLGDAKIAYKDLKKQIQRKKLPINEIEAPALALSKIPFVDPYFKTQLEESKKMTQRLSGDAQGYATELMAAQILINGREASLASADEAAAGCE